MLPTLPGHPHALEHERVRLGALGPPLRHDDLGLELGGHSPRGLALERERVGAGPVVGPGPLLKPRHRVDEPDRHADPVAAGPGPRPPDGPLNEVGHPERPADRVGRGPRNGGARGPGRDAERGRAGERGQELAGEPGREVSGEPGRVGGDGLEREHGQRRLVHGRRERGGEGVGWLSLGLAADEGHAEPGHGQERGEDRELGARHPLLAALAVVPREDKGGREPDAEHDDGGPNPERGPSKAVGNKLEDLEREPGPGKVG